MNEMAKSFLLSLEKDAGRREALPAHADKFIWVLDASSGNVLKLRFLSTSLKMATMRIT